MKTKKIRQEMQTKGMKEMKATKMLTKEMRMMEQRARLMKTTSRRKMRRKLRNQRRKKDLVMMPRMRRQVASPK